MQLTKIRWQFAECNLKIFNIPRSLNIHGPQEVALWLSKNKLYKKAKFITAKNRKNSNILKVGDEKNNRNDFLTRKSYFDLKKTSYLGNS
jgi:hypothetical protein